MFGSLRKKLNGRQLTAFLHKTLPEINRDYAELEKSLHAQQWDNAAKQAHKLLSIVKLLDMNSLIPLLQQIEQATLDSKTTGFYYVLQQTYQQALEALATSTSDAGQTLNS